MSHQNKRNSSSSKYDESINSESILYGNGVKVFFPPISPCLLPW
jgi:hypothetical protein